MLGLATCLLGGLLAAQGAGNWPKAFDAVSIKPMNPSQPLRWAGEQPEAGGRFSAQATPLALIMFAFNFKPGQIEGLPGWAETKRYAITAVAPAGAPDLAPRENQEMERPMVLAMLQQSFGMRFHRGKRTMDVLDLVIAKGGPKLAAASAGEVDAAKPGSAASPFRMTGGQMWSAGGTSQDLADALSFDLQNMVLDKTGLSGHYDYHLTWAAGMNERLRGRPGTSGPSIYGALPSQLGLRLEGAKEPVAVVVIDHIEAPAGGN